jgi:predicted nuclease with TOPRIM domain
MKLKNKILILSIALFLNFALAQEQILDFLAEFEAKKEECSAISCQGLPTDKAIECLKKVQSCLEEVQKSLSSWSDIKLKEIQGKIDELSKKEESLKKRLDYLEAQAEKTKLEIKVISEKIEILNLNISQKESEIADIEDQILKKEKEIENLKEKLGSVLKLIYEYENSNLFGKAIFEESLASLLNEIVFLENIQKELALNVQKAKEVLKNLNLIKSNLEEEKLRLEDLKNEATQKASELQAKVSSLEDMERETKNLLEITQGDNEKYQKLLAEIKAQTEQLLGDLSALARQRQSELRELIAKYGKVPEGLFGVPLFLQTNYPNAKLGFSNYSFSGYGCAVTSVAMVLKYYGLNVDPMSLNSDWQNIFSCTGEGWAFCWYGVTNPPYNMKISGVIEHRPISLAELDQYFKPQRPIIIFLNTATSQNPRGHYVVVVGKINDKFVVNDPILGTVYLDVSMEAIKKWYQSDVFIDQVIIYTP